MIKKTNNISGGIIQPRYPKQNDHQKRIRVAYQHVFGADGTNRNAQQSLVVEHLKQMLEAPVFVQGHEGRYDPIAAALNDGSRTTILNILNLLKTQPKPEGNEDE